VPLDCVSTVEGGGIISCPAKITGRVHVAGGMFAGRRSWSCMSRTALIMTCSLERRAGGKVILSDRHVRLVQAPLLEV